MAKEVTFKIEGVQGELKLVYGMFKIHLFQDGREIVRKGAFNPKYYVTNTEGEQEEMKIVYGFDFVHVVTFRGKKIDLEERLSTRESIVGGLPVLLILTGGLLGALFGIVGATFTYNYMRREKSFIKQLLVSLAVSAGSYVAYFVFALLFTMLIGR